MSTGSPPVHGTDTKCPTSSPARSACHMTRSPSGLIQACVLPVGNAESASPTGAPTSQRWIWYTPLAFVQAIPRSWRCAAMRTHRIRGARNRASHGAGPGAATSERAASDETRSVVTSAGLATTDVELALAHPHDEPLAREWRRDRGLGVADPC